MVEVVESEERQKRHLIQRKISRISVELGEVEQLRREARVDLVVVLAEREEAEGQ